MITTNTKLGCLHHVLQLEAVFTVGSNHQRAPSLLLPFGVQRRSSLITLRRPLELQMHAIFLALSAHNIHNFPGIRYGATLLPNDAARQAQWSKIAGGVPNITLEI